MKHWIACVVFALAGCAAEEPARPPSGGYGPEEGPPTENALGDWTVTFDGSACGLPTESAIDLRLELVDDEARVTRWALHEHFLDEAELTSVGAQVHLTTTNGPHEHVWLVLVDTGTQAIGTLVYEADTAAGPCELGPMPVDVVDRIRIDEE
jgi:hypothetical protein